MPSVNRKHLGAAVAAVLVATAAAYLPSIDGEFQFDDQEIAKTTWVRDAAGFVSPSRWMNMPRPLTGLTFALNHAMDGFRPRVWHATNVLVHLAAVLLAWRLGRRVPAPGGLAPAGAPRAGVGGARGGGAVRPAPAPHGGGELHLAALGGARLGVLPGRAPA